MIEAYARGFVLLALLALAGCHITKQDTVCGPDPFVMGDVVTHAITKQPAVVLASFCTGPVSGRTRAYSVSDGGGEFIVWYVAEIDNNNNTTVGNQ
jgi:hypothetical protein